MEELKPYPYTYNPCDECPYGIEMREGSGNDSMCKICELTKLLSRRAELGNKALTCDGCVHHNPDAPWPEICFDCKRQSRQDMYRRNPKGSNNL